MVPAWTASLAGALKPEVLSGTGLDQPLAPPHDTVSGCSRLNLGAMTRPDCGHL